MTLTTGNYILVLPLRESTNLLSIKRRVEKEVISKCLQQMSCLYSELKSRTGLAHQVERESQEILTTNLGLKVKIQSCQISRFKTTILIANR